MAKTKSATRRIVTWTGIIVGVLLALVLLGRATGVIGNGDGVVEVETDSVMVRSITQVVTASGKVQPEVEVKISPDVSGEIIDLRVREGDQVQQGELLVRIKPDFYTAQVEQGKAGVLQAQATQAQRQADLLQAEIELKRQQELYERKVISEADYQIAQTQYDVAEAAFAAAGYAVQSAEARLRESQEQLNKTIIYAPMTGTVSQLNVELGERVVGTSQMAGTEMMRIALLEQMELEVDVNENDVVNVSVGDTAAIEVDAYPERLFKGVVTEIANSARITGEGTQDQVINFPVKVRVVDTGAMTAPGETGDGMTQEEVPFAALPPVVLRPGMSGTVDVFTQTVTGAVAIPIQGVTVRDFASMEGDSTASDEEGATWASGSAEEDLRKVVFVVEDGKAKIVEVETGIADDTHIEVLSGLEGGEIVIIGPYSAVSRTLEAGAQVKQASDDEREGGPAFAAGT